MTMAKAADNATDAVTDTGDMGTVAGDTGDMDTATDVGSRDTDTGDNDDDNDASQADLSPQQLREKLTAAEAEIAQANDGLLRAKAEVENIRRRSQNEIVAARKFAVEGLAQELLGVRDSLERASQVALDDAAGAAVTQMKEGLALTLKQFDLAMNRFAVTEVAAAAGVKFDPELHQAISTAAADDIESGHIIDVVQKGFILKERLLTTGNGYRRRINHHHRRHLLSPHQTPYPTQHFP